MQSPTDEEVRRIIIDSLTINSCTIKALEYTMEMVLETEDKDYLRELESKIAVEYSKMDDVYSMIEKDMLQLMHQNHEVNKNYMNLLKYIRKNLKIIDWLEDIASKIEFARLGGTL